MSFQNRVVKHYGSRNNKRDYGIKKQLTSLRKSIAKKNKIINSLQTSMSNINEHLSETHNRHNLAYMQLESRMFEIQAAYDRATDEINDLLGERDASANLDCIWDNILDGLHETTNEDIDKISNTSIINLNMTPLNEEPAILPDTINKDDDLISSNASTRIVILENQLFREQLENAALKYQLDCSQEEKLHTENINVKLRSEMTDIHNRINTHSAIITTFTTTLDEIDNMLKNYD